MDIKTLESFKLSDAVKFHDTLNKKLFVNNKPRPEVKKQLLLIARDFIDELGVKDLDVVDVTISGSNAAYTYTKHSDLDLHILVDFKKLPNDEVYQELFNAKKTIYNDTHDIKVHGIPVELYVQDSNEPVISLGEYSLLKNKWLRIPVKRRANLNQTITKQKYDKLFALVQIALTSKDIKKVQELLKTIHRYRQAGLDKGGEFSPENLAYKALRSQGWLTKLYTLRDRLHSRRLSIENIYVSESKDLNNLVNEFKKVLKESEFDYNNIPTSEAYYNDRSVKHSFDQKVFRHCLESRGAENWTDIIRRVKASWGETITESTNVTLEDIRNFIQKTFKPLPTTSLKPKLTGDLVTVEHKVDNILSLHVYENKTIKSVVKNKDGNAFIVTTDGDVFPNNWEIFGYNIDAHFVVHGAEKIITWIKLSTDRVDGYRNYRGFNIDLPGEGPYDRVINKIKEGTKLDVPTFTPKQLSKKHNVSVEHIMSQLNKGIQVELEHTTDEKIAREIALDHLAEDPRYYDKLKKANLEESKIRYAPYFDREILTEQEQYLNSINGTVPINVWLIFLEEIFGNNPLLESKNQDFIFQVKQLEKLSAKNPIVGKQYIPIPIVVMGNNVYVMDISGQDSLKTPAKLLTLVSISDSTYSFKFKDRIIGYPYGTNYKSIYSTVIIVDDEDTYDKIKMMVELYFDKSLPPIQNDNLDEAASGYIPSNSEKNDPRYCMALTVDIKSDTMKKDAKKFGNKISRAGIPPTLKANGKF
jgi:hypothetical protein